MNVVKVPITATSMLFVKIHQADSVVFANLDSQEMVQIAKVRIGINKFVTNKILQES